MGERGPLPKRIEERRRRNVVPGETTVVMAGDVKPLPLPRGAHPRAADWYKSLADSGQAQFFEPSDWAAALIVVDLIGAALAHGGTAAQATIMWAAMDALLTTDAARRKARVFVQRTTDHEDEPEKPKALDEYRKALGG